MLLARKLHVQTRANPDRFGRSALRRYKMTGASRALRGDPGCVAEIYAPDLWETTQSPAATIAALAACSCTAARQKGPVSRRRREMMQPLARSAGFAGPASTRVRLWRALVPVRSTPELAQ